MDQPSFVRLEWLYVLRLKQDYPFFKNHIFLSLTNIKQHTFFPVFRT